MTLSAERIALANCTIARTFEQASIAWQSIPHWETGDPAQTMVRSDAVVTLATVGAVAPPPVPPLPTNPLGGPPLSPLAVHTVPFLVSLAQATADTPDSLLAAAIPRGVELAASFDAAVLTALTAPAAAAPAAGGATNSAWYPVLAAPAPFAAPATNAGANILTALILGRRLLEDSGFRAPSCLVASTAHFTDLSQWVGSNVATEGLLVGANANSLYRAILPVLPLDRHAADHMLMIGRRQQIAHGARGHRDPRRGAGRPGRQRPAEPGGRRGERRGPDPARRAHPLRGAVQGRARRRRLPHLSRSGGDGPTRARRLPRRVPGGVRRGDAPALRAGRARPSGLFDLILDYPLRGGKALRPTLSIATCRALGGRLEAVLPTAATLELYHNAFLIHDDIEDESLLRRGRPTLHVDHGIPIAINVGDAMLALSLQPLLDNVERVGLGPALRILRAVAR